MIISLEKAKEIDPNITQNELDGYEQTVRHLTNNNFQNVNVRFRNLTFDNGNIIVQDDIFGLREGDTIQISNSQVNDCLAVIVSITDKTIEVDKNELFYEGSFSSAFITKVEYPADILIGIQELIKYKQKMGSKMGIKSESIARMSVTYYDINATDNIEGFPASRFSFLNKYKKMRWG